MILEASYLTLKYPASAALPASLHADTCLLDSTTIQFSVSNLAAAFLVFSRVSSVEFILQVLVLLVLQSFCILFCSATRIMGRCIQLQYLVCWTARGRWPGSCTAMYRVVQGIQGERDYQVMFEAFEAAQLYWCLHSFAEEEQGVAGRSHALWITPSLGSHTFFYNFIITHAYIYQYWIFMSKLGAFFPTTEPILCSCETQVLVLQPLVLLERWKAWTRTNNLCHHGSVKPQISSPNGVFSITFSQ